MTIFHVNHGLEVDTYSSHGLIDSGSARCICSEHWLKGYENYLSQTNSDLAIEYIDSYNSFKVADDRSMESYYEALIPVSIGTFNGVIKTAVIQNAKTPLLISLRAQRSLGLKIDYEDDTMQSPKIGLSRTPIIYTPSGHYFMPLHIVSEPNEHEEHHACIHEVQDEQNLETE